MSGRLRDYLRPRLLATSLHHVDGHEVGGKCVCGEAGVDAAQVVFPELLARGHRPGEHSPAQIFMNSLPVEMVEVRDVSNVVVFLASDEARYVTGLEFTIDGGNTIR
jgi:NAD(P)-dependent dehydrogenase (short-subunit alcohol dehydrogenase family)